MSSFAEPPRQWQDGQHQRMVRGDPTAFAELCETALPHLVAFLQANFPQQDAHLHETIAIDLLLDYQESPRQYDPARLSLFAYLRMAARRDMLNAIDREQRRISHLADLEDPAVEFQMLQRNSVQDDVLLDEWLAQHTRLSREEILRTLQAELDPVEEQILLLMVENVRSTERYAAVMGLDGLDQKAQQRKVKQAKDRLLKKLRRFGVRVSRL